MTVPIDMVLHCPVCGKQHIDAPDEVDPHPTPEKDAAWWGNPPHRSHLCHGCGCIWRPADVPTNGVKSVKTTGSADTWKSDAPFGSAAERAVLADALVRRADILRDCGRLVSKSGAAERDLRAAADLLSR